MSALQKLCNNLVFDDASILQEALGHIFCFVLTPLWIFFPVYIQYFAIKLWFSQYYIIVLLYAFWMLYDRNTLVNGGRLQQWARDIFLWKYVDKYYPNTIHKTADFDPNKNYILGLHPHGAICHGSAMSFLLHDHKYKKLFPGIKFLLCVHPLVAWIPIVRELMLFIGLCSVNKEGIEYIVSKMGTGNAAAIVVGGGKEFFYTYPYKIELVLRNRKGFVRMALKHGACLVPCLSFGENEFLAEPNNRFNFLLEPWRRWSKRPSLQTICIYPYLFIYVVINFLTILKRFTGLKRYQNHFHTIIGKPIEVTKIEHPMEAEVDELHRLYIQQLTELFHENKKHSPYGDKYELIIH